MDTSYISHITQEKKLGRTIQSSKRNMDMCDTSLTVSVARGAITILLANEKGMYDSAERMSRVVMDISVDTRDCQV